MCGSVKHALLTPENALHAIAVVRVEIEDRDALGAQSQRMARGDGGAVEKAEAHRFIGERMMPRRARRHEGGIGPALHDGVRRQHGAACRVQRGVERAGADDEVGAEHAKPLSVKRR